MPHLATALDGPLADKRDLTVDEVDPPGECGKWPCEVVWPDEAGERRLYRFQTVSGPGIPEYKFAPPEGDPFATPAQSPV